METVDNTNMIHRLTFEDKEIILLGTAHVSKESTQQVKTLIESEAPETVCVELCQSRYQAIRNKDSWLETDIVKVIKEKKAFLLLSNLLLASFQKRIAKKLDIQPGAEMIQAMNSADAVGAQIELADRDIRITLSRTWQSLGLWQKIKLIFQLLFSLFEADEIQEAEIEKMKQEDIIQSLLAEVGKSLPQLKSILIDERDLYLSQKIRNAPGKKIVAVVGAGHVPGIKANWDRDIDLEILVQIPKKKMWTSIFKWAIPVGILGLLVYGFFQGGAQTGSNMLTWWIAANGIMAGIGAIIALAHPFTIVSSVIAAPLTSLNPMIAAGWVSGLVEAFSRKPRVKDFERLPEDILSIKGFWKNNVTRVLLVVVFTNLGSTLGTMVAIPLMMKLV
jgi:pheromone shutdown-related protein TraB